MTRISVIFCSSTGTNAATAAAIAANPTWAAWLDGPAREIEETVHDDIGWADGVGLGTPTRYGNPYGVSHATGMDGQSPGSEVLAAARHQGARLAHFAGRLVAGPRAA